MTTEVNTPKTKTENKTTRVVGTIMKQPEMKTSKGGNSYLQFPVVVDPSTGVPATWWNCKIMLDFAEKIPTGLLEKFRYAKFSGLGTIREYEKKDGTGKGVSNDLLITGVEMQNGEYIKPDKKGEGEDAPF